MTCLKMEASLLGPNSDISQGGFSRVHVLQRHVSSVLQFRLLVIVGEILFSVKTEGILNLVGPRLN